MAVILVEKGKKEVLNRTNIQAELSINNLYYGHGQLAKPMICPC